MQKNLCYSAALKYLRECKYSVIPVRPDKKPFIKWQEYQKRLPTEAEVKQWWLKYPDANVGVITGLVSGIAVIDIDDLREGKKALEELIPDSLEFPISKTPSGGEHWWFACQDGVLSNNARIVKGCDLRANGGYVVAPPSLTPKGAYKWTRGVNPTNIALNYLPSTYLAFLKKNALSFKDTNSLYKENTKTNGVYKGGATLFFEKGKRDDSLFRVANLLTKAKASESEKRQVLEILAKNCNPPFPLDELSSKILSAEGRQKRRNSGVKDAILDFISVANGAFSVAECVNACQTEAIVANRGTVRKELHRMLQSGQLKRFGSRDGWYVRMEEQAETINWWDADTKPLNICYPFNIEDFVHTYSKNIQIIAGEANSGKTAFMLNFAMFNMQNHKVLYCSSEMGAVELRKRLEGFEESQLIQMPEWRRVKFIERTSNFADIIDPDGINIIDFLEISDNFYLIAQYIKEIYDKLKNGICMIGIQKDKKKDFGRGGTLGLEKPRLYLNMGHGELKIIKAKIWAKKDLNPNNMNIKFKLVNGAKFILQGGYWKDGQ